MPGINQRNPTWGERLDSLIGFFSPETALRRASSRLDLRRLTSPYDSIPAWRGNADWAPVDGSGEALKSPNRELARAKARHLERNSEVISSVLNAFDRNVVGKGFNLQVRTDNQDWNNILEDTWQEFSRPGNCDVTGRFSLKDILKMIVRRKNVDGAVIALKTYDDSRPIPFQLQMLEVDELEGPVSLKSQQGNPIVGGVEINAVGKPVAYWLKQIDFASLLPTTPKRFTADRVFFLMDPDRFSDVREISHFVKALGEIRDLDDFFDATGFKQKINAAMAVFITQTNAANGPVVGNSRIPVPGVGGDKESRKGGKRIDAGSITYLRPGEDVKTLVPSGQSSELNDFNLAVTCRISSGHGLSYEMVSRDVSQVNYSSARQNLLEDQKVFEGEQQFLIEHFLDFVFEEVIVSAILSGKIPQSIVPKDFWTKKSHYLKHEFMGQGMPWIDPYKEAMANKLLLETGQITLKELYARRGMDFDSEFKQLTKEAEMKKQLADINGPAENNAQQTAQKGASTKDGGEESKS